MFVQFGERIACEINPATDSDIYRFSGVAGDRVLVEALWVAGDSFLTTISLVGPEGAVVDSGYSRVDTVLPDTGTYTAIVFDTGFDNIGEYAFTASCLGGACLHSSPEGCSYGDIDGNGTIAALSDGLLTLRYMFGFRGTSLTQGAVDPSDCTICTDEAIEGCLAYLLGAP